MSPFEEQVKLNSEWLATLSGRDIRKGKYGLANGRRWALDGKSFDTIKAVVTFFNIASGEDYSDDAPLWDSNHDAAFDHYHEKMCEAVGNDADFDNAQENDWGHPYQIGWFRGVREIFQDMVPVN